ncbi:hypothetical protein [Streptomyces sp. Ag109_G2-15]|uniref:hypothetical protein n=1 Tax=Streptomyces sp. Ag109_G2-15 TaxID=1938850 RepID=UPI000BE26B92|nr:hypothetical protein [Streptomyces sp. Ag109_G2-15]
MRFDDNEPAFKRSKWGTNRYEYNPRNPMGFTLIVVAIGFAVVMLLLMHNHAGPFAPPDTSWSPAPDMSRWAPPTEDPHAPTPSASVYSPGP